jgi:hypothetical protein
MRGRGKLGKVGYMEGRRGYQDVDGGEMLDCMGGDGVFTSAEEYIKILKALLTTDEDEALLKKDIVESFFMPQLGEGASAAMNGMLQDDMVSSVLL